MSQSVKIKIILKVLASCLIYGLAGGLVQRIWRL